MRLAHAGSKRLTAEGTLWHAGSVCARGCACWMDMAGKHHDEGLIGDAESGGTTVLSCIAAFQLQLASPAPEHKPLDRLFQLHCSISIAACIPRAQTQTFLSGGYNERRDSVNGTLKTRTGTRLHCTKSPALQRRSRDPAAAIYALGALQTSRLHCNDATHLKPG